ncbi:DUF2085 domain-containing protein [Rhodohalobacter halophilus]|uniref:DUF2085 domain-containing protein n=1 Tax=Rhodohalobacter halophilus TaxID=1812810 RepID=UPI00083F73F0|nr:DUF2085 domain-containing protein [Rhodohalobacter halophilus]
MKNRGIYVGVLAAFTMLLLFSLGSGVWGGSDGVHWTEQLFMGVCHQLPDRTFTFMGERMAVNTRCFGIFLGLWIGWVVIPLFNDKIAEKKWPLFCLLFAGLLQIIDYSGNLFLLWENTNSSRFVLGTPLGFFSSLIIADLFQSK